MWDFAASFPYYQDYGWFLSGLVWLWIALGLRFGLWRDQGPWLPWVAWSGVLRSVIELGAYAWPVEARPNTAPYWWVEFLLIVGCDLLVLVGLTRSLDDSLRLNAGKVLLALGGAVFVIIWPAVGVWIYAGGATLLVIWRLVSAAPTFADKLALACVLPVIWLTSEGPLASSLTGGRRWLEVSDWSHIWSLAQFSAAAVLAYLVCRSRLGVKGQARHWRGFIYAAGGWVALGAIIAYTTSENARKNFESAAISRAVTALALMDGEALENFSAKPPQISAERQWTQPSGLVSTMVTIPELANAPAMKLRAELSRIEKVNPDIAFALLGLREGDHLYKVVSLDYPKVDLVTAGREVLSAADTTVWDEGLAHFARPTILGTGNLAARAPWRGNDDRVRAWLILGFETNRWLVGQVQARLQTDAIVLLGLGLAGFVVLQRIRTQEREEAREAARAATAADRQKSAFLAKVSHELRTPIQSILGYSELLQRDLTVVSSLRQLGSLREHGRLLLRLVNDLLDIESMRNGAFRLVENPAPMREAILQTVDSLRPRAEAKGLALRCTTTDSVPKWARCDVERIRQIALNLVTNAIKFTDAGEVLVLLHANSEGREVCFGVKDSGPGIGTEDQARIFEPFARLDVTASREGTGLGLAMVAGLCESMGGGVKLESVPGKGSHFEARWRCCPVEPPETRSPSMFAPSLGGRRILVADDNALVRELFTQGLESAGATVLAVGDGEEVIAVTEEGNFDAVVMDLAMPRMDGLVATQLLRSRLPDLRIVNVSAHASEADRQRALSAGANEFMTKPVELSKLIEALHSDLGGVRVSKAPARPLQERLESKFREEAAIQWGRLQDAATDGDWKSLREAAHYLRNSALVVGDSRLGEACLRTELAAEQQDSITAQRHLRECAEALVRWMNSSSVDTSGFDRKTKNQTNAE